MRGLSVRAGLARFRGRDIELKTAGELTAMRAAGALVAKTLAALASLAKPGVSTGELDVLAEHTIRAAGGVPSFLSYHGYPASICTSVNNQVVHGIPSPAQLLSDGDLVSIDCGAILDGWHGDAAITVEVGAASEQDAALSSALSKACRGALEAGVAAALPFGRLTDISYAVQTAVQEAAARDERAYAIVADYGGHGIGSSMHMDPYLPNEGRPGRGPQLHPGMALAIEPMLTAGGSETRELEDGWTVVTADGSMAVHWEHTVAITEDGPWVLTAPESA